MNNTKKECARLISEFYQLNKKSKVVKLCEKKAHFRFNQGDYALLKVLFPSASFKLNNYQYLSIRHKPSHIMVAHILIIVRLRIEGNTSSKAFSVKYINENKSDLRYKNIRVDTSKDKKSGKKSILAYRVVDIRLNALMAGECPDAAMILNSGVYNYGL